MSCRKEIILKFVIKQSAGILKGIIARIGDEYAIRFCCLAIIYPFTIHMGSLKITEVKETKEVCSSDYIRSSTCWRYIWSTLSDPIHIYFPTKSLRSSWHKAVWINSLYLHISAYFVQLAIDIFSWLHMKVWEKYSKWPDFFLICWLYSYLILRSQC